MPQAFGTACGTTGLRYRKSGTCGTTDLPYWMWYHMRYNRHAVPNEQYQRLAVPDAVPEDSTCGTALSAPQACGTACSTALLVPHAEPHPVPQICGTAHSVQQACGAVCTTLPVLQACATACGSALPVTLAVPLLRHRKPVEPHAVQLIWYRKLVVPVKKSVGPEQLFRACWLSPAQFTQGSTLVYIPKVFPSSFGLELMRFIM